jgi:ATP-dependent Clp protease ATP-binding subunit ClpA
MREMRKAAPDLPSKRYLPARNLPDDAGDLDCSIRRDRLQIIEKLHKCNRNLTAAAQTDTICLNLLQSTPQ